MLQVQVNPVKTFEFTIKGEAIKLTLKRIDEETDVTDIKDLSNESKFIRKIRKSIIDCDGFVDENDKPIKIQDEDGTINEDVQKAIFHYVYHDEEINKALMVFVTGVNPKNLETGVQE